MQYAATTLVYPGATNITACVTAAIKKAATGTIQILDGARLLTALTLQGNGCAYWYIAPGLAVGSHSFTVSYSGDTKNAAGVSSATVLTVNPVPTTMSLSKGDSTIPYGVAFKRTVTISSNAGSPTGNITYILDSTTPVSLALSGGNTLINIAPQAAGTHTVRISYLQQTNFAAAASQTVSFTVTPATTAVTIAPSAASIKAGTSVTFTAAVTSTSSGVPNAVGNLIFRDGGIPLTTVLVNSTGKATYTTSSLATGLRTITANNVGTTNYAPASVSTKINVK